MDDLTLLLQRAANGEQEAEETLFRLLYHELQKTARSLLSGERSDLMLDTVALVNEAYLRLIVRSQPQEQSKQAEGRLPSFPNRRYFFAAAAEAMRRILVDRARAMLAQKRGGRRPHAVAGSGLEGPAKDIETVLLVHEMLDDLEKEHPEAAEVVRLRFFGGYSTAEVAQLQDVSESTVKRRWRFARAWLYARIQQAAAEGSHEQTDGY